MQKQKDWLLVSVVRFLLGLFLVWGSYWITKSFLASELSEGLLQVIFFISVSLTVLNVLYIATVVYITIYLMRRNNG
jgi:hypothetical protein